MDLASTNLPAHSTGQLIFFLPNSALLSSWGLSVLSTLLECAFPQGQKLPLSSARWTQHPTSDTLTIPFLVKMGIPQHKVSDSWVGDICFRFLLLSSISKVPETVRITLFSKPTEGHPHKAYLIPRGNDITQGHFSFTHLCVQSDPAQQACCFQFF